MVFERDHQAENFSKAAWTSDAKVGLTTPVRVTYAPQVSLEDGPAVLIGPACFAKASVFQSLHKTLSRTVAGEIISERLNFNFIFSELSKGKIVEAKQQPRATWTSSACKF